MSKRISSLGHALFDPRTLEVRYDIIVIKPGTVIEMEDGGEIPQSFIDRFGRDTILDPVGASSNIRDTKRLPREPSVATSIADVADPKATKKTKRGS